MRTSVETRTIPRRNSQQTRLVTIFDLLNPDGVSSAQDTPSGFFASSLKLAIDKGDKIENELQVVR